MEDLSEKINFQTKSFMEENISSKQEYDNELNLVIKREEVMNSVLEKMIDNLKQTHARVSKGKR